MLRATNLRHAETERARAQLMAILGHDLRDPLHTIDMAARVLEQGDAENKMSKRIRASSSRMQRLVGQVLDLSRLGSGIGLGIDRTKVDIATLVSDLVDEARVAQPGIHYEVQLPKTLMWSVDADRLSQAVGNLLGNARLHGGFDSSIGVTVVGEPDTILIEISNDAAPIDPALVSQLFSPFKKQSGTQGRSGLGLGLYIAHEIVVGHGGKLAYRYQAPSVIFSISLPKG